MTFLEMYGGRRDSCPVELQCSEWILKYFSDCICNYKDSISFAFGLASVFCWGVAEIPQIVSNFLAGNTEGVSLIFLLTWTVGDAFNLVGCVLEPATLPTQFLMALLYTITTVVLVSQSIWYQFAIPRKQLIQAAAEEAPPQPSKPVQVSSSSQMPTSVINVPAARKPSPKDIFISSARSLVSSHTPTMGSFIPGSGGGHSWVEKGHSALSHSPHRGGSSTARAAMAGMLLVNVIGLFGFSMGTLSGNGGAPSHTSFALSAGSRKLLQAYSHGTYSEEGDYSSLGQTLGWIMAAIYMGGRIPQIWLNIQRGSVEGLSPLMFLFALLGNATYVGSILVRSLDWNDLQPNLAWLTDAAVCVFLDLFILGQFVYYSLRKQEDEETEGEYEALK